jgi:protein SCO1/2/putative membrane protein
MCPNITRQMARAQELLEGTDARLVSFSVDPEHDTPEVLRAYADAVAGADPERWWFLTGDQEAIYELIRKSFLLAVAMEPEQDPGLLVAHSAFLVAVDESGRIRGYYDGESDAGTEAAVARIRFLDTGAAPGTSRLPKLNASLNAAAAVLLGAGLVAIRRGRRELHGRVMSAAFLVSAVFLACYLYYHLVVIPAQGGPVRFRGTGWTRPAYLALLATHVVGAIVNLPMVLRTLWLARRARWEDHRRWARRTFPLWMYVSVTGVLVYLALYTWNPPPA